MEWSPLHGYEDNVDFSDKPRKLTNQEIDFIVSHIPYPPSADSTAAEICRQGIVEWVSDSLREVSIAPSAIPELIERIVEQHYKSLVTPGTPVGITAAEALGATTTQMTLNTFHSSGSATSVSFGIDAIRDIIFARKNPKNESCTIYFKNNMMSYEEVLNTRTYIVGSVVSDFVKDYTIDNAQNLSRFWWHEKSQLLFDKDSTNQRVTLRLFLNIDQMYKHKVTVKDIADTLQREMPPTTIAVYGPISDAIIDLYPTKQMLSTDLYDELKQTAFFENTVLPELKNIRVKGISGIRELKAQHIPVWSIVLKERRLTEEDIFDDDTERKFRPLIKQNNGWILYYNTSIMRSTGINCFNLGVLCDRAGMKNIGNSGFYLVVQTENPVDVPSKIVAEKVAKDKKQRLAEIKRLGEERLKIAETLPPAQRARLMAKSIDVPRSELIIASEFCFAITVGSNLRELLSLPGVDKTRTTCNNMFTIASTLGIEAVRTYSIRALIDITSNAGSYINPTNITLIAEFIVSRGEPHGATYTGISRQPGGHLSLATLERAGQVFAQSALTGRKEDIRNVSASVAVGTRMAIGDGFFDVGQDIVVNGMKKTFVNDDLFTAFKNSDDYSKPLMRSEEDIDDALNMLTSLTIGQGFDLTKEEEGPEEFNADLIMMFDQEDFAEKRNGKITSGMDGDILSEVKVGVPLKEVPDQREPVPMISKALMQVDNIAPPPAKMDLSSLLTKLSAPKGAQFAKMMTDLRREQIGQLE